MALSLEFLFSEFGKTPDFQKMLRIYPVKENLFMVKLQITGCF